MIWINLPFSVFAVHMSISWSLTSMPPLMGSNNAYKPLNTTFIIITK